MSWEINSTLKSSTGYEHWLVTWSNFMKPEGLLQRWFANQCLYPGELFNKAVYYLVYLRLRKANCC